MGPSRRPTLAPTPSFSPPPPAFAVANTSPAPTDHPTVFRDDTNILTENGTNIRPVVSSPAQLVPQPPPLLQPAPQNPPPNGSPSEITNFNGIGSMVERPTMVSGTKFFRNIFLRSNGTGSISSTSSSSNNPMTAADPTPPSLVSQTSGSSSSGDSYPFNTIVRPGGDTTTTLSREGGTK